MFKRKVADRVVNNKEVPHRKWSVATLCAHAGLSNFESTNYLLMPPMGTKVKKETKSMSGVYHHYFFE